MKKSELRQIIKEEISNILKPQSNPINFRPEQSFDKDHYIDFKEFNINNEPMNAEEKLNSKGIEFTRNEDGEFIFPKMSYKTWDWIKELFFQEDIRGIGQY